MEPRDFYERIFSWLWLYEHSPFPMSDDSHIALFNDEVQRCWAREMLSRLKTLKIPEEYRGTETEHALETVVRIAGLGEQTRVVDIYFLLTKMARDFISKSPKAENNYWN